MGGAQRKLDQAKRRARRDAGELERLATDSDERHRFAKGLRSPRRMPARQRDAVLLLVMVGSLGLWALGSAALRALGAGILPAWDAAWLLAWVSLITTVGLPIPFEPALFAAVGAIGAALTVAVAALAKTAGAVLVFYFGGAIRKNLADLREKHPIFAKGLDATEKLARHHTYLVLGALLAVPFFPDTLPLYLFALLGLKMPGFLLASFAGIAVRSALLLWLGASVAGA